MTLTTISREAGREIVSIGDKPKTDGESFYSYDADDTFTGSWPSDDYDDYYDFSYEESYVGDYAGVDEDAWW